MTLNSSAFGATKDEPTADDLAQALARAIDCKGIPGARAEARQELQRLRNAKWTWFGERENRLRTSIVRFLDGRRDD